MSKAFDLAIKFVLPHEEEFARGHWGDENFVVSEKVSGDSGGLTKWGIDQSSHPGVDIEHLKRGDAIALYALEWERYNIDKLPEKLAVAQFDVRVNGGYAIKWLQNALNQVCRLKLAVDGVMGPSTLSAAQNCNVELVLEYFISERDARFDRLAAANPKLQKFRSGWKQRDTDLRAFLKANSSSQVLT